MARIREFRHLFSGTRRIVATIRIDLDQARKPPGSVGGVRCKWEGTKEPQPSAELYPEYKQQWIDGNYRWIADELGRRYGHAFETPEGLDRVGWRKGPCRFGIRSNRRCRRGCRAGAR